MMIKLVYVLHPSWYLSTLHKLRVMCITDGCTHVCTLNGLHCHMKKQHYKGEYNMQGLAIVHLDTIATDND